MLHGMFLAWEAYTHSWCFSTVLSSWLIPVYRFCILMIYEFVKGKQNCLGFLGNAVLGTPGLIRGLISLLSESLNPFNFPERQRIKMIVKYWAEPITERKGYCWMALKPTKHSNRHRIRWLTNFLSISIAGLLVQEKQFWGMHLCRCGCRLIPYACEWFSFCSAGLSQFHLSLCVPSWTSDCGYSINGPTEFRNLPCSSRLIPWKDGRNKTKSKLEFICLTFDFE